MYLYLFVGNLCAVRVGIDGRVVSVECHVCFGKCRDVMDVKDEKLWAKATLLAMLKCQCISCCVKSFLGLLYVVIIYVLSESRIQRDSRVVG